MLEVGSVGAVRAPKRACVSVGVQVTAQFPPSHEGLGAKNAGKLVP